MNENLCHCSCHSGSGLKHMMACCHRCPHCQRRIKYRYYEHKEQCAKEQAETLAHYDKIAKESKK